MSSVNSKINYVFISYLSFCFISLCKWISHSLSIFLLYCFLSYRLEELLYILYPDLCLNLLETYLPSLCLSFYLVYDVCSHFNLNKAMAFNTHVYALYASFKNCFLKRSFDNNFILFALDLNLSGLVSWAV